MEETKNLLANILEYNKNFVSNKDYEAYETTSLPDKKVVVLSCMDTRLTELLPKALNLKNGDAKIIKNAGATVMHPFGSIIRSIIVAIYEFDAKDILVIGHLGCGMSQINPDQLLVKMKNRGIEVSTLSTLDHAGIDLLKWLEGFESVEASIVESVNMIRNHPLIPSDVYIHGLIMDPKTGEVDVIVDGYRA
ncbi:MAG TPA: carbonic anhydrase [Firmicutes bacterium]|nr:carbonic anhydrase [Bacillota bacterium]